MAQHKFSENNSGYGTLDVSRTTLEQIYAAILLTIYCMPLDVATRGQLHSSCYRRYLQIGGQFFIRQYAAQDGLFRILNHLITTHGLVRNYGQHIAANRLIPHHNAFNNGINLINKSPISKYIL